MIAKQHCQNWINFCAVPPRKRYCVLFNSRVERRVFFFSSRGKGRKITLFSNQPLCREVFVCLDLKKKTKLGCLARHRILKILWGGLQKMIFLFWFCFYFQKICEQLNRETVPPPQLSSNVLWGGRTDTGLLKLEYDWLRGTADFWNAESFARILFLFWLQPTTPNLL